jgi:DNA topoisomerase IA
MHTRNPPVCDEGDMIKCTKIIVKKQDPYLEYIDEAKLLKQLELIKVGRPSTVSTIVPKLIDKKYVLFFEEPHQVVTTQYTTIEPHKPPLHKEICMSQKDNRRQAVLKLTDTGSQVLQLTRKLFPVISDLHFTERLESYLDKIEAGEQLKDQIVLEAFNYCCGLGSDSITGFT